jgi:hypothetical protein
MDGTSQASLEIVSHNYAPFNAAVARYIEKLEQPDPRIAGQAFREKARGVGHVLKALGVAALLILIGVSLLMLCQQRNATAAPPAGNPGEPPERPIILPDPPSPTSAPGTVVTKYTRFTTVRVAEASLLLPGGTSPRARTTSPRASIVTWRHLEVFGSRKIDLARRSQSGELIRQASMSAFNGFVREIDIDYETALRNCVWFSK